MTFKEIKELITLIAKSELKEFRLKDKEFEIRIRTDKDDIHSMIAPQPMSPIMAAQGVPPAQVAEVAPPSESGSSQSDGASAKTNLIEIKSPMVGTFYRSPSPDKSPYIQVGDVIGNGDVVCIIEAMKLFNEIESEVAGKIVKVIADDSSPVEYDQVLFLVDPNG